MCVQVPSSETILAEGVLSPRARRTPPEGALRPRARRTPTEGELNPRARRTPPEGARSPRARRALLEGARSPRARRTLLEGRSVVPPWRATGTARTVIVSCALGSWVSPCFVFFAGFKRVSPSYFGDPCGCPRQ
jgi:hypothetical protein